VDETPVLKRFKDSVIRGETPREETLYKGFTADAVAIKADGLTEFTISTGAVDREGDTIDPKGWDLGPYKKNPVVLWAHMHTLLPVGNSPDISLDGKKLRAAVEFTPEGEVPFNDQVRRLVHGGFLKATSVGFLPRAWERSEDEDREGPFGPGFDFKSQELLEFSIVPVPANPEALIEAKAKGYATDEVVRWAEKTLDEWTDEDHARLRFSRSHLERAYWALEDGHKALILDFGADGHGPEQVDAKGVEIEEPEKLTAEQGETLMRASFAALTEQVEALKAEVAALATGKTPDPDPPTDPPAGADEKRLDEIEREFDLERDIDVMLGTRSPKTEQPPDPETVVALMREHMVPAVREAINRKRGRLPG